MRSADGQQPIDTVTTASPRRSRPDAPVLRRLLLSVTLCGLLAACSGATAPRLTSNRTASQLQFGLNQDATLLVTSPDLNRRLAEYRLQPSTLDFSIPGAHDEESADLPDDLKLEFSTAEQDQKSKLMLHFAEEGRLLDRANLDTHLRARNWLLGFRANMVPAAEDTASRTIHLESEFSGLLGRHLAPPSPAEPAAKFPGTPRSLALFQAAPAPKPYYLAFHDASLGADGDGTLNFLFSLGGYPGEDFGELMTTYRLLSLGEPAQSAQPQERRFEQAVAIGYRGNFSGWIKSFGHTLTYFNDRGPGIDTSERHGDDPSAPGQEAGYQKWQSRFMLSCGDDLRRRPQGLLHGYRLDLQLETQAALQRSGLLPAESPQGAAAWGSQLRLNTVFGTLSGKLSRSPSQNRIAFGLQKTGLAGAKVKLYYEDIDDRSLGELETRIGGQLNLPFDETLLKVLTLDYWKATEADLFAAQPARGYTAPRRGQHVPSLNNATPGILQ